MVASPSSIASARACALWGLEARLVSVEVDVAAGVPAVHVVGLPDASIREARERVRAAVRNSGFEFPLRRVTVSLAPAERRKEGSGFDLAIAVGLLRASGQLRQAVDDVLLLGELSLDGTLRPVRGCLPRVAHAVERDLAEVIVPVDNAAEAAAVEGARVRAAPDLRAVVAHIVGEAPLPMAEARPLPEERPDGIDLADISGQESAKRALEIAAAGGHNLLMVGPPGTGKTLLARALVTILPALSQRERFEASVIHSVAGLLSTEEPLLLSRPFRQPHHGTTAVALVGGASPPRPGEISLAHRGVLMLDELAEFPPQALEAMREPLEEGRITIARAGASATYPARTILVAAMNPCPCGFYGDPEQDCTCLPEQVKRYRARVSGPLLDRIDLRVGVPRVPPRDLSALGREASAAVRGRVEAARARMRERGVLCNAELPLAEVKRIAPLGPEAERLLERAVARDHLSSRGYHRVVRVARTIADLEGARELTPAHLAEALAFHRAP